MAKSFWQILRSFHSKGERRETRAKGEREGTEGGERVRGANRERHIGGEERGTERVTEGKWEERERDRRGEGKRNGKREGMDRGERILIWALEPHGGVGGGRIWVGADLGEDGLGRGLWRNSRSKRR